MKKLNVLLRYLMPLMPVAAFAGCASTPTHESTGQYVDNTVIPTEVKAALSPTMIFSGRFQISVTSYKDLPLHPATAPRRFPLHPYTLSQSKDLGSVEAASVGLSSATS